MSVCSVRRERSITPPAYHDLLRDRLPFALRDSQGLGVGLRLVYMVRESPEALPEPHIKAAEADKLILRKTGARNYPGTTAGVGGVTLALNVCGKQVS